MLYVIQTAFEQDQDGTAVPSWSCSKAVYTPVWHIPLLNVQLITPDDGQRSCPKHAEFHFQNKFEKLVRLVGVIIRKSVTVYWFCVNDNMALRQGERPQYSRRYPTRCVSLCTSASSQMHGHYKELLAARELPPVPQQTTPIQYRAVNLPDKHRKSDKIRHLYTCKYMVRGQSTRHRTPA
jgi:hypothetical protein